MYKINFHQPIHVHFIGIGGISMSGLAQILLQEGFMVSGSDSKRSDLTAQLEAAGAGIAIGQRAANITPDIDLVVYTAAIHPDNPEYMQAKAAGIPMLSRAEFLGQLMTNYHTSAAVAGTHGKTTTTGMLTHILLEAQTDPTVSIGGMLQTIGGNIRVGKTDYFLTEACEYTNSFLHFYPTFSVILNIEEDHMDFFDDLAQIRQSFRSFASNTAPDGKIIINSAIAHPQEIYAGLPAAAVTFGLKEDADYTAADIAYDAGGRAAFTLCAHGKRTERITLKIPGRHNIENALAAAACAAEAGLPFAAIRTGLASYGGTARRFERKGSLGGITIIDDYAHHPTEIRATLSAARPLCEGRLICVFQPHTYTRTKAFWDAFADALCLADIVVLAEVYAARETDTLGISGEKLAAAITAKGTESHYFSTFDEIENFLLKKCINRDLLITMGAGDVYKIGDSLLGI